MPRFEGAIAISSTKEARSADRTNSIKDPLHKKFQVI